jgi:hypothetical protein
MLSTQVSKLTCDRHCLLSMGSRFRGNDGFTAIGEFDYAMSRL